MEIHLVAQKKVSCRDKEYKNVLYVLWYGQPCRVGLSLMNLPNKLLQKLETEEDLSSSMAEVQVLLAVTS